MPFPSRNYHLIDDDDDELDHEVCYGEYRVGIVGIRYYNGTVNKGEMVSLVREPLNPYDKNAIRVDNVCGIQVGHIKRTVAMPLASVIDRGLVRLEGTVPFGQNNMFTMPCDLSFWGKPEDQETVVQAMRRHGFVMKAYNNYPMPASSQGYASNHSYSILPKAIRIPQDQMHNELNKLFDKMEKEHGKVDEIKELEPAEAIKTNLYPHQKQSLAWMISKENNNDLPPFWQERTRNGKKEYFNSATNFAMSNKPSCVKGGILADDMGLGKTLQMITLILTNFRDGKPLATLDDAGTGISKTLKQKIRRPRKNTTTSKTSTRKNNKRSKRVESSDDDSSVEEISDDDNKEEEEEEEEDDEMVCNDSNNVMISKDDPDFKPVLEDAVKPQEPTNLRRSGRSRKKPTRYAYAEVHSDIEEEEDADSAYPSPPKKSKMKKVPKTTDKTVTKSAKEKVVSKENVVSKEKIVSKEKPKKDKQDDDDCQIVQPPLPSFANSVSIPAAVPSTSKSARKKQSQSKQPNLPSTGTRSSLCTDGPRTTLVICPLSVISNWENEFDSHVHPNLLNIYTYYGQDRTKDKKVLEQQDIVLTTYQTLSTEYSKGKSPLKDIKWLRIVLDEGHCIRNPKAQMTKAIHALNAERRWVVTGTPIQNSMKDLWSIICFLRLEPFLDRQWWVRSIERPISQGDKTALSRVQSLMHVVALRRTKTQKVNGRPIVELPDRDVFIQPVELSLEERKLYDSMANEGKLVIGKYVKSGTILNNYADVLAILMRLRQLCCHPGLCASVLALVSASANSGTPEELREKLISSLITILSTGVDEECPICLDSLISPVITHCAHVFCRPCIENVIKSVNHEKARCPLCRGEVRREQLVEVPEQEEESGLPDNEEWHSSSKVDCLMSKLTELRTTDASIKSLVISQFTSLLNLVEVPLKAQGFSYVRLDGSMTQARRAQVIDTFNESSPDSPTVFLLSMKAGGVGLNLTAACRVFLLDPAWNPAAEEQCFDRCHRLGQTRNVIITKFIVKDSVEERMLDLQNKKRELMSEAFKKKTTADQRRKQRINDLKSLMDL